MVGKANWPVWTRGEGVWASEHRENSRSDQIGGKLLLKERHVLIPTRESPEIKKINKRVLLRERKSTSLKGDFVRGVSLKTFGVLESFI